MTGQTATGQAITVAVSFEALVAAITQLSIEEKERLADVLEEQIAREEEAWENSPEIRAQVEQARREHEAGEVISVEELMAEADAEP